MTDNLVSAVSRFMTPELIGKMASVSGLDRGTTQSAVGASVPAILSGLADVAGKPGGARQMADMIEEQPTGLLSNLTQTLGTSGMSAERGGDMLSSLLGGGMFNTLVSTLSRFIGIGEGSTRTLIGLLTPVILGVLGREQRAAGLEASGLARMLTGQHDQITAAMPAGLSDLLTSRMRTPQGEPMRTEARARTEGRSYEEPEVHARARTETARRPDETRERGSQWGWAYWVLPLLALGGLLWYLLPGGQDVDRTATAPTPQTTPGTQTPGAGPTGTTPGTAGKVAYLEKAQPDWMPINAYYQQDIYNKAGEKIGVVKDLLVSKDGRVQAAVLSVGQFLGVGERNVAVPMSVIVITQAPDGSSRMTVDVEKDALQSAPTFKEDGGSGSGSGTP